VSEPIPTADIDPLLEGLTDPQVQAVMHVDGPLLIIAAAGSGKTRVITRRVAYLMRLGIEPNSILSVTFTNKAAGEMKQRISATSPRPIRDWGRLDQPFPLICTFHSLCLRILKHYATRIGLTPNFSLFDSADQTRLIKEAMKILEIPSMNFQPSAVHAAISNAKNKLLDVQDFERTASEFHPRTVARIFKKYQELLKLNNGMDFDDLLLRTAQALRSHPDVLAELQERFRYMLIDEYQDTNHAQYVISHALVLKHRNICVVGDPDQSIYAWRGADIQNILDFETDYPDATVIRLEQNYRSTKTILAIAEKLISHNTQRKDKRLWTENHEGAKAKVLLCQDEHDEARAITEELRLLNKEGIEWSRMAIFYRMNALSRVMEDALRMAQVPYQIARGVEFYNRKEIKDVLAYLRTVANPDDEVSLTRIVNVPTRGLGDTSIKLMQAYAVGSGLTLWGAMREADKITGLSTRATSASKQFVALIESFRAKAANPAAGDIFAANKGRVQTVMEDVIQRSGMAALLRKEDPDAENQVANVNELISAAAEYDRETREGSLDDYLSRVSLVSDADHLEGAGGAVTLMTLHAAKGLEFPVVAIIGMEEGCLPHSRTREHPEQLEEERRLCFVGITRAQERLILSKAQFRMIRGKTERTGTSQFLAEMPREYLEVFDHNGFSGSTAADLAALSKQAEILAKINQFSPGQKVRHPAWGVGKIVELSNSGTNTRAIVQFPIGQKTLILEYARLTPV
jgi:DNA helicase II / ATP-dependent DNA helicase PcrA